MLVLLVLFGGWKFLQVHNEQNNVNELQSNIASLNAQVPKYDLVVAANDAYTKGLARRASVLNSAVDWPLALSNLISITPANAQVQTFNGSELGCRPRRPRVGVGRHDLGGSPTGTQSAAIGTIDLQRQRARARACRSRRPGSTPSPTSQYFANPLQGATTVEPDCDPSPSPSPSRSPRLPASARMRA